ncbi:MAG: NusG domain II-containing protein [Clostridia bacterium]|jgi:hypothetical protein|nr:NusG domain II-containing protein [Clostridia bacterium]
MANSKKTVTNWKLSKKALIMCLVAAAVLCAIGFVITYIYAQNQPNGEGLQAEIYVDDTLAMVVPLESDGSEIAEIPSAPGTHYQHVTSGCIRILSNDCNEQTCVKTGWIDELGETITCPEKNILIKITPLETKANILQDNQENTAQN